MKSSSGAVVGTQVCQTDLSNSIMGRFELHLQLVWTLLLPVKLCPVIYIQKLRHIFQRKTFILFYSWVFKDVQHSKHISV